MRRVSALQLYLESVDGLNTDIVRLRSKKDVTL